MNSNAAAGDHRRVKSAGFLFACGCAGAAPHWLDPARSLWPAISLAVMLGGYGLRTALRGIKNLETTKVSNIDQASLPSLDVVVAARDEESVVTRLVDRLSALRYPTDKLNLWLIDDGSVDATPQILDELAEKHSKLQVIHRSRNAGGGKSGALNTALTQLKGEWLLVLDADAQVQHDLLERLIPYALLGDFSAVQLRKAVIDADKNWLTRSQAMEMALDALIQKGRLAGSGVTELRGNGQLIKRSLLEESGGFNEETVTDDLDLSFRLLINGALIGILWDPPVEEEAVPSLRALWRQRQRWAEGGLQRFFDYWPQLVFGKLSFVKRWDLANFFLLQYGLPVVSFADLSTSIISRSMPCYWPLSFVVFGISGIAYWRGCRGNNEGPIIPTPGPFHLLVAITYLVHWFFVIPWVALRMALFPKSLVWAKTSHGGDKHQPVRA